MKYFFTLFSVLTLCAGALALGQEPMKHDDSMKSKDMKSESMMKSGDVRHMKMMSATGTVTRMDKDGRMMMMKDAKGKEMTMYWDDSTKVKGDMMEGSRMHVHYMMRDGRMMAHDVTMTMPQEGPKERSKPAPGFSGRMSRQDCRSFPRRIEVSNRAVALRAVIRQGATRLASSRGKR